jgi:hypothetical protein
MSHLKYVLPMDVSEELLPVIDDANLNRQFAEQKDKPDKMFSLEVILGSHCLGNYVTYNLLISGSFTGKGNNVHYEMSRLLPVGRIEHTDNLRVRKVEDKVREIENKYADRIWSDWDCDGI